MVLNKTNIITRVGKLKYNAIILRILLKHTFLLILFNVLIDYLFIGKIELILIVSNIVLSALIVILLPKRKEYDNELLIIVVISLILKLIFGTMFINKISLNI